MRLLVIGAGGHAKVVVDAAREAGFDIAGVLGRPGDPAEVLGIPVVMDGSTIDADAFIVAIGDNTARAAAFAAGLEAGLVPATVIHPSATLADEIEIGRGTFAAAGVIVNVNARIGENVILNTGCTVDHDCLVEDHAHIAPGANLCGGVSVGEGTLVGVGSCALPGASIGAWATIGAGAAVTEPIGDGVTTVGVPARPLHPAEDAT